MPKRGFNNPKHKFYAVLNVRDLEEAFEAGSVIDLEIAQAKGLVGKAGAGLKLLADGELTKSVTVKATKFSLAAKAKIEAAGGACETV